MPILPVSKYKLISNNLNVMRWDAWLIIGETIISFIIFWFLPESSDPIRRIMIVTMFIFTLLFTYIFYFTAIRLIRSLHYLPFALLPPMLLVTMYILPTISFYYLPLLFIMTTAYANQWGGDKIGLYYVLSINTLLIYSLFLSNLPFPQSLFLGIALSISFIYVGNHHIQFAKEVYFQRREKIKIKKLIQAIRSARNHLLLILNSIADGVITIDSKGNIRIISLGAKCIFSISKPVNYISDLIPLDMIPAIRDYIKGNSIVFPKDITYPKILISLKNGDTKYIKVTISPLNYADINNQSIKSVLLVIHDITQEQQLENMKLDFVSIAAHELRTPITSIRGYLAILQAEAITKLTEEERKFLERVYISSNELSSLIDNLLNVSRIERGALKLTYSEFSMNDLVSEEIQRQQNLAEQKNIKLILHFKTEYHVNADRFWIGQVIMNLLSNAIKYTQITGQITIQINGNDRNVFVDFIDNGQGIPKDALNHMFEKFFRVSGTLEEGSKGTGLGLFITKAIINAHNGEITVNSEVGQGSTFSFRIPR